MARSTSGSEPRAAQRRGEGRDTTEKARQVRTCARARLRAHAPTQARGLARAREARQPRTVLPTPPGAQRRTFEFRPDQLWTLDDIQRARWRRTGCKPTLSALLQEALDHYLQALDEGESGYGGEL